MQNGYYINLERMISRREFMDSQLSVLGLDQFFSRWPGVDAATMQMESIEHYVPISRQRTLRPSTRWELSGVEIAIFESHRTIWKDVIDRNLPYAIILEDDLKLSVSIRDVMGEIEGISNAVDVLKLDGVRRFRRFGPPLSGTQLELRPIVKQRVHSTGGYLVSREGAGKLLRWSEPYSDQADAFVFCPRAGYRLFQLFPAVALQGALMRNLESGEAISVPTTPVPDSGVERKLANKGPHWFRLLREARQGIGHIGHFLGGDLRLEKKGGFVGIVPLAADLQRYS